MPKRTEPSNHTPQSSFWFGFALGSITLAAGAFLFGTKQGRKTLQKMLELSENLEDNVVSLVQEVGETIETHGEEVREAVQKAPQAVNQSSLGSLLTKMRLFSPHPHKQPKKFFTKE